MGAQIVDYIPANATWVSNSIVSQPHSGAAATVSYYSNGMSWTTNSAWANSNPTNVEGLMWQFNTNVGTNNGDAVGVVDGPIPDDDAGYVIFKITID